MKFKLNTGQELDALGYGTWFGEVGGFSPEENQRIIKQAIGVGFRHIDTATVYGMEADVGAAVESCGVDRDEIFVTTKLWWQDHNRVKEALQDSLAKLKRIDLWLMHYPVAANSNNEDIFSPTYVETWLEMEALYKENKDKVKAIGVSNFSVKTLTELLKHATIVPAANQVEFHPMIPSPDLLKFHKEHGIQTVAYSSLGAGDQTLLGLPVVTEIAEAKKCTTGQVLLAYGIGKRAAVIPRSSNEKRMMQNLDIVTLSDEEMAKLDDIANHRKGRFAGIKNPPLEYLGWEF